MADRILRMLLGVLVGAWVARSLGPSLYGELAYGIALVAIFQSVVPLGTEGVLVREICQFPQLAGSLVGTTFRLRLIAGLLAWGVVCTVVHMLRPGDVRSFEIVALIGAGMMFQATDVIDLWFQSQTQSRRSVVAKAVGYCSSALIRIVLIVTSAPLWAFAATLLAESIIAACALWFAYTRLPLGHPWSWCRETAIRLMAECWPYLLAGLAVVGYMRFDQIMLRELASETELGMYSAVLPFVMGWTIIPTAISVSVLPRLSTLRQTDMSQYRERVQQVFSVLLWVGLLTAGLTAIMAHWLVFGLLGVRYASAVPVLQVLAFTNVFVFLGVAQSMAIVADRTARILLYKTLMGLFVGVLLNIFLMPKYGAMGATWSALAAQLTAAMLSNIILAPDVFLMQVKSFMPVYALGLRVSGAARC